MAQKWILLDEEDVRVLQGIIDEKKKYIAKTESTEPERETEASAGTYLAYVPPGGISAFAGETGTGTSDLADFLECEIYRPADDGDDADYEEAGFTVIVHNPYMVDVEGDQFIPVMRDNFGKWYPSSLGGRGLSYPTVEEADGSPSVSSAERIQFSGATVSQISPGVARVTVTGGGSSLAIGEVGGSPYFGATLLTFDEALGFNVAQLSSTWVNVSIDFAGATNNGILSWVGQTIGGTKTFTHGWYTESLTRYLGTSANNYFEEYMTPGSGVAFESTLWYDFSANSWTKTVQQLASLGGGEAAFILSGQNSGITIDVAYAVVHSGGTYKGATATVSGLVFKGGLYISGTFSGGGSGTVTSVGLSLPSIFSVSGSPVTTSGTLTGTLATQTANYFFAGPTSGSAAAPTFRAIVAADLGTGTADNTKYLRGDLTWQTFTGLTDGDKGDLTVSSSGTVWTIDNGVVTASKFGPLNGFTDADPNLLDVIPGYDTSATANADFILGKILGIVCPEPGGRLSPASGNVFAQTTSNTLYYTPYKHNNIVLWDGTRWVAHTYSELSIATNALGGGTIPYDVFVYDNSGTVTLYLLAWSTANARATNISLQDGRFCLTGDKTKLYLGTFLNNVSLSVGPTGIYIWNMYNRCRYTIQVVDTTDSWTYTTNSWRQANNNTSNQIGYVVGLAIDTISVVASCHAANSAVASHIGPGIGVNSTTTNIAVIRGGTARTGESQSAWAYWSGFGLAGYNYIAWLERSTTTSGTTTFYGDAGGISTLQTGLLGELWA